MDHPDELSFDSNRYLRHEAQMWELDCLAEQEMRAQQIQEDFGLECDVGKLVGEDDYHGWFNAECAYGSSTPHRKLAANESWCGHYMHPDSSSVRSDSPDVEVYDACSTLPPMKYRKPDQRAIVGCSSPSQSSPSSSRESTPEKSDEGVRTGCLPATPVSSSSSRKSTPELPELSPPSKKLCIRRSSRTRPATSKKSSASSSASSSSSSTSPAQPNLPRGGGSLPPGAFWDRRAARPVVHCGLPGCTQKCSSTADVRRHRESLAHRAEKRYACPGCPMRFTREDALKRHLGAKSGARCGDPGMGALRDEFLRTEVQREAQRAEKPDRVVIALYKTFLRGISTKTGSLKTGGRKRY